MEERKKEETEESCLFIAGYGTRESQKVKVCACLGCDSSSGWDGRLLNCKHVLRMAAQEADQKSQTYHQPIIRSIN